ncbi:MAG: 8-amino-7-oxononanoate synthase [Mariprofundaceae bacterium]|nr:8-amino-7-oxononanoate synthase [Mariprofundaceae bacterium]
MLPSMHDMPDSRNWFAPTPLHRYRVFNRGERQGMAIQLDGRRLVNFSGNDYLGLSFHTEVCRAAVAAIKSDGTGSGASRLISGDAPLLHRLEMELAAFKGFEAALLVGSGMLANTGVLPALADRHSTLCCDRLNHASLVDGARLSAANVVRYSHLDMRNLELSLQKQSDKGNRKIIVSDGVFSMDGDCANVGALLKLAERYDALLLLDDAHGFGTLGKDGRGLSAMAAVGGHARLVEVGTCGKALGSYGAFILGTNNMIDGLRQRLRTMTYSTALPVSVCAASLAALQVLKKGEVVRQLHKNIYFFRDAARRLNLPLPTSETPIQPLLIGDDAAALKVSEALAARGFFVAAIRPPTVPQGTARLRITLSAAHSEQEIDALVQALAEELLGVSVGVTG